MKSKKMKALLLTCAACFMIGSTACSSKTGNSSSSSSRPTMQSSENSSSEITSSTSQEVLSSSTLSESVLNSVTTSSESSILVESSSESSSSSTTVISSSSEEVSSEISNSQETTSSSSSSEESVFSESSSVSSSVSSSISSSASSTVSSSTESSSSSSVPEIKYTINFNSNGAGIVPSIQWNPTTILNLPTVTKSRNRFEGWFYDSACTQKVEEANPSITDGITLYAGWTKVYEVRLYSTEWDYTQVWYAEGETVDVSEWEIPDYTYNGQKMFFDCWMDEWLENEITNDFVMGTQSMAFYAQYSNYQTFEWEQIGTTGTYKSTGRGVLPFKNIGGYYGTFSADLVVKNYNSRDIGLAFNANIPTDISNPHEAGCSYWYMHFNPSREGCVFQLAYWSPDTGYKVVRDAGRDAVASWAAKYNEFINKGTNELLTNFKVEYTPTDIKCYIDNNLIITYSGDFLNTLPFTDVAIRTDVANNEVKNINFVESTDYPNSSVCEVLLNNKGVREDQKVIYVNGITTLNLPTLRQEGYKFGGWYTDFDCTIPVPSNFAPTGDTQLFAKWETPTSSSNGYGIYSDGSYISQQTSGYSVVNVPGLSGKYGLWEADVTIDQKSVDSKLGLIIHSDVAAKAGQQTFSGANCYYLYHNASANVNFTIASEVNGTYTTFTGHKTYADGNGVFVLENTNKAYNEVLAYYNANKALKAGTIDSYTVRLGVEILPDAINLYVGGKLYFTYLESTSTAKDNDLKMFEGNANCTGMGFAADKSSVMFSNYNWTNYLKNNFLVKDGTYTSLVKNAITTVDGLGGQYGTWEVDVTVTDRSNNRVGILINANIADNKLYGDAGSGQGYYLHHNVTNGTGSPGYGRFALVDYYNGYRGYTTLAASAVDLKSVNLTTGKMAEYHVREKAFLDGTTDSVTMRMGLRVTPSQIDILLDGEVVGSYNGTYYKVFSQGAVATGNAPAITASTGVGFTSVTTGTIFANFTYTPYVANS